MKHECAVAKHMQQKFSSKMANKNVVVNQIYSRKIKI
jgi:hypothetical protein